MAEDKQEKRASALAKKRPLFQTKKDVIKFVRGILELVSIIVIAYVAIHSLFVMKSYQHYDENDPKIMSTRKSDHGFVALSYFGVDRQGTDSLIAIKRLDEELSDLKRLGYVTVSQKDLEDYYYHDKPLPKKAVFIMFEDGRKDTLLFTEKLLEKMNYQASILTYGEKFKNNDQKFVSPKDLQNLQKQGFWELGTNGYRLSYINAYDRYGRFLGELDSREFVEVNQFIGRNYNHYLMDYIRDKNHIPVESTREMDKRLSKDYQLMKQVYGQRVGQLPDLYCLMHSNTSRYGNNANVSAVNARNLEGMFKLNVNREGYSWNSRKSSPYDLTRLEPQAWWYRNHLLMRIRDDLPKKDKGNIKFVKGNKRKFNQWKLVKGAAEFKNDLVAVTSESESNGLIALKNKQFRDCHLQCELLGNKIGQQTIYLRTQGTATKKKDYTDYLAVSVENNVLYVRQKTAGHVRTLVKQDMFKLHDDHPVSIPQDKQAALTAELKVRAKFARNNTTAGLYRLKAAKAARKKPKTVKQGAKEYVPTIQIQDPGDVKLDLTVAGDRLDLKVDGIRVAKQVKLAGQPAGGLALESIFGGFGASQRNIADDVYDGVFKNLVVTSPDDQRTYYDERLHGWDLFKDKWSKFWNAVINWFIVNL